MSRIRESLQWTLWPASHSSREHNSVYEVTPFRKHKETNTSIFRVTEKSLLPIRQRLEHRANFQTIHGVSSATKRSEPFTLTGVQ